MSRRFVLLLCLLGVVAYAAPVLAQQTVTGTIPAGSDGAGIASEIEGSWSQGEFSCSTDQDHLHIVPTEGPCVVRGESVLLFKIDQGSTTCTSDPGPCTSEAYSYQYQVGCENAKVVHRLSFNGQPLQQLAPGYNTFIITVGPETEGGTADVIRVKYDPTNLVGSGFGGPQVPALGIAGAGAALLLLGGTIAWRLRQGSR